MIYGTQTSVPIQGREHRLWNQSRRGTRAAEELQQEVAINSERKSDSRGSYSVTLKMSNSNLQVTGTAETRVSKYLLRTKENHTHGIKDMI